MEEIVRGRGGDKELTTGGASGVGVGEALNR